MTSEPNPPCPTTSALALLAALLGAACDQRPRTRDIGAPEQVVAGADRVEWDVSSAERFGMDPAAFTMGSGGSGEVSAPSVEESMDTRPVGPAANPDITGSMARGPSGLVWQAPPGWRPQPDRAARVVTFHLGPESDEGSERVTECYVTRLAGVAGGVQANIDRWCRQMGAPPLTPQEFEGLPRIGVLGVDAPVVEVDGSYTGMNGESVPEARLIGTVIPLAGSTLFVKLTGPREVVAGERDAFLSFCRSLREEGQ